MTSAKKRTPPRPPVGSDVYFCERCEAFAVRIAKGVYDSAAGLVHTSLSCGHTVTLSRPQRTGVGSIQRYSPEEK